MSNIYLDSSYQEKVDVLKTSICQVWKIFLQVKFWQAPTHTDVTEF